MNTYFRDTRKISSHHCAFLQRLVHFWLKVNPMNAKVFMNDSYLDCHDSSGLAVLTKSLCRWHDHVLETEFRLYPKNPGLESLDPSLRPWSPAVYFHVLLACLERNNADSVAGDRVSAFQICGPDFYEELWPSAQTCGLVVHVKGVVPLSRIFCLILKFFIGFTVLFARNANPIVAWSYRVLAEAPVAGKSDRLFDLSDEVNLRGWKTHFNLYFKIQIYNSNERGFVI